MNPFELFKNMQNLQSQMQQMQSKLEELSATGSSGAGMVEITINGKMEVQSIFIDPQAIDPADAKTLETLVAGAFNQAVQNMQEELKDQALSLSGASRS
ncbi:MAG: YbaB/EbfC family nucleoid-associated protein [Sphaerochaetaceae bacterium]